MLTFGTQIVMGCNPTTEVGIIIDKVMEEHGVLQDYKDQRTGSGWFVEVPTFMNSLYDVAGEQAVLHAMRVLVGQLPGYEDLWDIIEGKKPLILDSVIIEEQ